MNRTQERLNARHGSVLSNRTNHQSAQSKMAMPKASSPTVSTVDSSKENSIPPEPLLWKRSQPQEVIDLTLSPDNTEICENESREMELLIAAEQSSNHGTNPSTTSSASVPFIHKQDPVPNTSVAPLQLEGEGTSSAEIPTAELITENNPEKMHTHHSQTRTGAAQRVPKSQIPNAWFLCKLEVSATRAVCAVLNKLKQSHIRASHATAEIVQIKMKVQADAKHAHAKKEEFNDMWRRVRCHAETAYPGLIETCTVNNTDTIESNLAHTVCNIVHAMCVAGQPKSAIMAQLRLMKHMYRAEVEQLSNDEYDRMWRRIGAYVITTFPGLFTAERKRKAAEPVSFCLESTMTTQMADGNTAQLHQVHAMESTASTARDAPAKESLTSHTESTEAIKPASTRLEWTMAVEMADANTALQHQVHVKENNASTSDASVNASSTSHKESNTSANASSTSHKESNASASDAPANASSECHKESNASASDASSASLKESNASASDLSVSHDKGISPSTHILFANADIDQGNRVQDANQVQHAQSGDNQYPMNRNRRGKFWTATEDETLARAMHKYGSSWTCIAKQYFKGSRNARACFNRWKQVRCVGC
jgi:hypothetical protein